MQYIFDLIDTDGSGTLDLKELYEMFEAHHLDVDREHFAKLFKGTLNFNNFKNIS